MDQDLDLSGQQSAAQPPQAPLSPAPQQFSTDEIFNKLFEEEKMTWVDVMSEMIEWIDLKFPTEGDDLNLLDKFQSFNNFISNFYTDITNNRLQK